MERRLALTGRRQWIYYRDLLRELVVRDMKLRYKRSVIGVAWSLLNPLIQLLVLQLIFRLVLPLNIPNYTSFLFTGLLAWNWFQTALYTAAGSIVDGRELVKRPGFPVAVLPAVTVSVSFLHFLLALPILLVFLLFSGIPLTAAALILPGVYLIQFLLTLGPAYLLATIHVRFRDTQYLLGVFLLLGFYLSPVFYDAAVIPERFQWLYSLNPMAILIDAYRQALIYGQLPRLPLLAALGIFSLVLFWVGYRVFQRASARFPEEL